MLIILIISIYNIMTTVYYIFKERNWTGIPDIRTIDEYVSMGYYMNEIMEGNHYPNNRNKMGFNDLYQALVQLADWMNLTEEDMSVEEFLNMYSDATLMFMTRNAFYLIIDEKYYFVYKHDETSMETRDIRRTSNVRSLKYDRLVP